MRCPACDHPNPPGVDECQRCQTPLTQLDIPTPHGPIETSLMTDTVATLHPRPPVTVPLDAELGQAIRQMIDQRVGAVLVTNPEGELVGILTERDFLTKVVGQQDYERLPVARFMTPAPVTVTASDLVAFALSKMDVGGYRHLPVVAGRKPIGVISIRDVLRHLTLVCPES
jgi:CBS domain-containing protein